MSEVIIRPVSMEDAPVLVELYGYYVEHTAISFEYDIPSITEFEGRIKNTIKDYPYLVAEQNGELLGYAYGSAFHERAAYSRCAEVSIYVKQNSRKGGIGRRLYETLEQKLKEQGILNLYACIAYTEEEDSYLNNNSAEFHEHLGYEQIGRFHKCGYKFGHWYDMIWMEKFIGEH